MAPSDARDWNRLPGLFPTLSAGDIVDGKYRVQRCLGHGAYGVVYLVEDTTIDMLKFALKGLHGRFADRQLEEARLCASLDHPNIVKLVGGGVHAGHGFLLFEYLQGQTLGEYLQEQGALPWRTAVRISRDMSRGLAYAHAEKGIQHGDVHPNNVFIQNGGTVKVLDFGLAYVLTPDAPYADPRGAPGYMAPEHEHDERSTVFSAAMVMYSMLKGGLLRVRVARLSGGLLEEVRAAVPTRDDIAALKAPDSIRRLIERATRSDPTVRPRTMGEWLEALRHAETQAWRPPGRSVLRASVVAACACLITWTGTRLYGEVTHVRDSQRQLESKVGSIDRRIGALTAQLPARGQPATVPSRQPVPPGEGTYTVILGSAGQVLQIERVTDRLTVVEDIAGVSLSMVLIREPEHTRASDGPEAVAPFFIGSDEITIAQWRAVAKLEQLQRPLPMDPSLFGDRGDLPVQNVSWEDVREFFTRLRCYTGRGYRLPTNTEWTFAARGGRSDPFGFGSMITRDVAHFDCSQASALGQRCADGLKPTGPKSVGSYRFANSYGLRDMIGNVWELAEDPRAALPGADPRVWPIFIRGGAYSQAADRAQSISVHPVDRSTRAPDVGFRAALDAAELLDTELDASSRSRRRDCPADYVVAARR